MHLHAQRVGVCTIYRNVIEYTDIYNSSDINTSQVNESIQQLFPSTQSQHALTW